MQRHTSNDQIDGLVGSACEVSVNVNGIQAQALLDTGSTVSTMSLSFYKEYLPHLEINSIQEMFNLKCANGTTLPYHGYIEVDMDSPGLPIFDPQPCLFLIVDDNQQRTPLLIGTNILNSVRDTVSSTENRNRHLSTPWFLSFRCLNLRQKELQKRNFKPASIRCAETHQFLFRRTHK